MCKKILTISLLIIILMSIFSVNCYASTIDFKFVFKDYGLDFPDISIVLPSGDFKYFTLLDKGDSSHIFYISESLPVFSTYRSSNNTYKLSIDTGLIGEFILNKDTTSWTFNRWYTSSFISSYYNPSVFLYSNYDIKYKDEVIVEAHGTPLVRSVRSVKTLDSVLNETISILPITLTVVVGLVAIRKGISFTTKKIRNA